MDIILIIGFSQAFILSLLVFTKNNRTVSDRILSVLFVVYGITLVLGYLEIFNRKNNYPYPFFIHTAAPFILLHGPALWFYIKSLTTRSLVFKAKYLLHFLPFVIVLIILTFNVYLLSAEEKIIGETQEAFKDDLTFPIIIAAITTSTLGYFVWGLALIKNHQKRIKLYFSEISDIDLKWLRFLLLSGIGFYATICGLYLLDYVFNIMPYAFLQFSGFSFASFFILWLGYFGHKQGNIFTSNPNTPDLKKPPLHTVDTDDHENLFLDTLYQHMREHKPYLNAGLTIAMLSEELQVGTEYLSTILNSRLKKNFFDFINQYRIEEFKRLCRQPENQNLTLLGIAYDSGFNSKASFNRVFKKSTGMTPGEYARMDKL